MIKTREEIVIWLADNNIEDYVINEDLSVDVNDVVKLSAHSYENGLLPIQFGYVSGGFFCQNSCLLSLVGCPYGVLGSFDCSGNQLSSLEGGPGEVRGGYSCDNNSITSLRGSPNSIAGDFDCSFNSLVDLRYCPEIVKGGFNCYRNKLDSLFYLPESVGDEFNCGFNDGLLGEVDFDLLNFAQIKNYISNKNLKESLDRNLVVESDKRSVGKKI